jgi:hypothetical protein
MSEDMLFAGGRNHMMLFPADRVRKTAAAKEYEVFYNC